MTSYSHRVLHRSEAVPIRQSGKVDVYTRLPSSSEIKANTITETMYSTVYTPTKNNFENVNSFIQDYNT